MDVQSDNWQRWMISEINTLDGQQEWCKRQKNYRKTTKVVRSFEDNEREAHSERNARWCEHTREKKKGATEPNGGKRDRPNDKGGADSGQHNKQGSMENKINSYAGDPRWRDKPGMNNQRWKNSLSKRYRMSLLVMRMGSTRSTITLPRSTSPAW